ncbi:hypothetical protein GQX74_006473 [Glossina fuscipes]|nr:hypothetical protein GQX74_006473 [Glossina fuscipes]
MSKFLFMESCISLRISHQVIPNRTRQRLIPLTPEIHKVMMDFNASRCSTSIPEQHFYNTLSITSLVREEVQNILHELSIPDKFIRKEEIDELIEKCLKEKVTIVQEQETKSTHESDADINQEIEVTLEMMNESDKNKLIVENFQILEQRITTLEERLNCMLQNIPKTRHLEARKFKINTDVIEKELRQMITKADIPAAKTVKKGNGDENGHSSTAAPPIAASTYDDIYYAQREYTMNLLTYKKSLDSLQLNEKPKLNPFKKPLNIQTTLNENEKCRQRSSFFKTEIITSTPGLAFSSCTLWGDDIQCFKSFLNE